MNRRLAIGATGVVLVLGGTGGAIAATQGSPARSGRRAYLDAVAKHLGVSPGKLGAAIRAADTERIEAAVAAGRLTPAQARRLKERLQGGGALPLLAGPRLGRRHGAGVLRLAADYLGVSAGALRAERAKGRSLAQIAAATPGRSAEGLKEALVKAIMSRLPPVQGPPGTSAQAEQHRRALVERRVERLLARTGTREARAH